MVTLEDFEAAFMECHSRLHDVPLDVFSGEVLLDADIKKDLGMDDTDIVILTMEMERLHNITITPQKIAELRDSGSVTVRNFLTMCNT